VQESCQHVQIQGIGAHLAAPFLEVLRDFSGIFFRDEFIAAGRDITKNIIERSFGRIVRGQAEIR
jgi:hypothetical protein